MAYEPQAKLMGEIAALFSEYRAGGDAFVKFGLKCAMALNRLPVAAGIMMGPKRHETRYQIGDPTYREHHDSEADAFAAAFEKFAANAQFLAWNGKLDKVNEFEFLKAMSDNFTRPTMSVEMIYRRRGEADEHKLSMFFIGFPNDDEAKVYASRHSGQVI